MLPSHVGRSHLQDAPYDTLLLRRCGSSWDRNHEPMLLWPRRMPDCHFLIAGRRYSAVWQNSLYCEYCAFPRSRLLRNARNQSALRLPNHVQGTRPIVDPTPVGSRPDQCKRYCWVIVEFMNNAIYEGGTSDNLRPTPGFLAGCCRVDQSPVKGRLCSVYGQHRQYDGVDAQTI